MCLQNLAARLKPKAGTLNVSVIVGDSAWRLKNTVQLVGCHAQPLVVNCDLDLALLDTQTYLHRFAFAG